MKNNRTIHATTVNTVMLALVTTVLAACGGGGEGAVEAATAKATDMPEATAKAATTASIFYGMNGHITNGGAYDNTPYATQLSQLQDLGVKIFRNDVYNLASAKVLATVAKQFAAGGVQVYPVMLLGLGFDSEEAAYNAGFVMGQQTAQTYKFTYYEVANELDSAALAAIYDGNIWWQYSNRPFTIARGVTVHGVAATHTFVQGSSLRIDTTKGDPLAPTAIERLTLQDGEISAAFTTLSVSDVAIHDTSGLNRLGAGISVLGGQLTVTNLAVTGFVAGIQVDASATVTANHYTYANANGIAIAIDRGDVQARINELKRELRLI